MTAKLLITMAIFAGTLGCTNTVRPGAEVVAKRLKYSGENSEDIEAWLASKSFNRIERHKYGGPWPTTGGCMEIARGRALGGVDIVRFCANKEDNWFVFSRNTHGHPWTEVYPTDLSAPLWTIIVDHISDKTMEALE